MIIAVVVTYNRLEYLKKLLNGLQKQTIALNQIIVVNNDSKDGTAEWLNSQKDLVVIHQENSGGSGGFYTGVKAAFMRKPEWIWIMDDDIIPRPSCLEILMNYKEISKCLNPIHINHEGLVSEEERWFNSENCHIINHNNQSLLHGKKIWFRNIGSFEGMLISTEIVAKIGFPDKRFFISHDDLIYGYLANKYTNVAVIADAIVDRQPVSKSEDANFNYYYYNHRNLWLLEEYLKNENDGLKGYRNRRVILYFIYSFYKIFRLNEFKSKRKAANMLWKAYKDYRSKKTGKSH